MDQALTWNIVGWASPLARMPFCLKRPPTTLARSKAVVWWFPTSSRGRASGMPERPSITLPPSAVENQTGLLNLSMVLTVLQMQTVLLSVPTVHLDPSAHALDHLLMNRRPSDSLRVGPPTVLVSTWSRDLCDACMQLVSAIQITGSFLCIMYTIPTAGQHYPCSMPGDQN